MSKNSPRSEGKCAVYGRESANDMAKTVMWRARLHNEQSGMPKTDKSGANTSVSLLWNPASAHQDTYALKSHRKMSQLKQVQDFGISARAPAPAPSTSFEAAVRALHAPARAPAAAPAAPAPRAFLDGETARLKAAAHARNIGQTFLQAGNLAQARAYLARAEQILQVDERHLKGKKADDILDEFMQMRKDPQF